MARIKLHNYVHKHFVSDLETHLKNLETASEQKLERALRFKRGKEELSLKNQLKLKANLTKQTENSPESLRKDPSLSPRRRAPRASVKNVDESLETFTFEEQSVDSASSPNTVRSRKMASTHQSFNKRKNTVCGEKMQRKGAKGQEIVVEENAEDGSEAKSKKAERVLPRYMTGTQYMDASGRKIDDRHKTPCPRLERKGLQNTVYRDDDPKSLAS